jgi:replication initiation protein RepC
MSNTLPHALSLPTGFRRLTPGLLRADRAADRFDGLPDGVENHHQLLAALKAAASMLGLPVRLVQTVDWLFRFTRPQDWEPGARPIVWPSASMQQEALGLAASRVKVINRGLIDAGLITMKDSPNGKRYGQRDHQGRIVEAYGFDLSPLASRHAEFVQLAAEAKEERKLIRDLRRRATIARRAIAQILETASDYGFDCDDWLQLRHDVQALIRSLRQTERPEEIAIGVGSLERRQTEARARLEQLLDAVETGPKGPENKPHIIPTNQDIYPDGNTVMANKGAAPTGSVPTDPASPVKPGGHENPQTMAAREGTNETTIGGNLASEAGQAPRRQIPTRGQTDGDAAVRLSIEELTKLAPRLRPYLTSPRPAWPEVVDAADWLRGELGVSQSLWGEACVAMGRRQAAIAIAIVSAKPAAHFRSTPGGYFHGMVAKAKAGELNLARTVWGLRQIATSKTWCDSSRPGSGPWH